MLLAPGKTKQVQLERQQTYAKEGAKQHALLFRAGMERIVKSRNKQGSRLGKTKVKEQCICISTEVFRLNFTIWIHSV